MAFKTNKEKKKNNERTYIDIKAVGAQVINARQLSEKVIVFTLKCAGFSLYNMKMIDGEKGEFIAPSQHLGKDGKWYDDYAVYLSEEDVQAIKETILKELYLVDEK